MGIFRSSSHNAKKDIERTKEEIKPYYQPYIDNGANAMGKEDEQYNQLVGNYDDLHGVLQQLLTNPTAMIEMLSRGYQPSKKYQNEYNASMGAINNAEAAGGMAGSLEHQDYAGGKAADLAGEDMDKYLKMAIGLLTQGISGTQSLYNTGLKGLGHEADRGYNASNSLAQSLGNLGQSEANLDYASDVNHNNLISRGIEGAAYGVGRAFGPSRSFGAPRRRYGGY